MNEMIQEESKENPEEAENHTEQILDQQASSQTQEVHQDSVVDSSPVLDQASEQTTPSKSELLI